MPHQLGPGTREQVAARECICPNRYWPLLIAQQVADSHDIDARWMYVGSDLAPSRHVKSGHVLVSDPIAGIRSTPCVRHEPATVDVLENGVSPTRHDITGGRQGA